MSRTRGNKAKKDRGSILADVKNLLYILHPAMQRMPKIERIEGAPVEMKHACYELIRHFTVAMECQEVRLSYIHKMFADFGRLNCLKNLIHPDWWQWLAYDERRRCLAYLPKYSIKSRINNKYHLKLKHHDTIRHQRAEKRSLQREVDTGVAA